MSDVLMTVPAEEAFASVAAQAVQGAGEAFGMPGPIGLALALASEEIIAFAARCGNKRHPVSLICRDGRYRMVVELSIAAADFEPRFFNLPRQVSIDNEDDVKELGLLLTARAVDSFSLSVEGGELRMVLDKLRPYTTLPSGPLAASGTGAWSLQPVTTDHLARLCRIISCISGTPSFLLQPGRVIDMVEIGELAGCVAERSDGSIAGGILWAAGGDRVIEVHGPYLEPGANAAAEPLVEACLMALARSTTVGVICRNAGMDFPEHLFEPLGIHQNERVFYRELQEDMGALIWVDPGIEPFLAETYHRLGYARQMTRFVDNGQRIPSHSVIAVETLGDQGGAVLRPCLPGADVTNNVTSHRDHLAKAGLRWMVFEVDLGVGWQLSFVPGLLGSGFEPAYIIPNGGRGDLLMLRWLAPNGQ